MIVDGQNVRFDLKGPCDECPYRKGAKFHNGVFKDLFAHYGFLEAGRLVFTCHKTDPRADSDIGKKYKGDPQHCGGLLSMMCKDVRLLGSAQVKAIELKEWDPLKMRSTASKEVFKNYVAMVRHYYNLGKARIAERKK